VSKFLKLGSFEESAKEPYVILPFRFTPFDDGRYILTNLAGEYVLLPRPELHDFARHRLPPHSETYRALKSRHFLLDQDSSVAIDLLALKVRTKFSRLPDFTGLHLFVVTLRCEHSCPYCQVSRQNDDTADFDMSAETADRALEFVFRSPSPHLKIEFQGGEPLLNFPMIQHVVARATEINKTQKRDLAFVIATNLALIDDDILLFCRQHDIHLSTSLDGPANLHNRNRPRPGGDSYERAIAGIQRGRAFLGHHAVSAVMTTTAASLARAKDIIDEYVSRDFRSIFLRPMSPYGFAMKTKWYHSYDNSKWLDFYFEGLDYIIDLNKSGVPIREYFAATVLKKMLTPYQPGYVDLMSPAGIGIGALVYNYDGDVYASDEGRMLAEMGDKSFRLGSVLADNYEDVVLSDALLDALESSFAASAPMCATCAFEPYCGAEPVYHHATQGNAVGLKPMSGFCNRNMAIFKGLIDRMEADDEARSLFRTWANS
jgi:His-Xaa-Ser system radical SAM maturase HxsB